MNSVKNRKLKLGTKSNTMKIRSFSFSGLTPVSQDSLKGTEAKISCIVTGLTKILDAVKWAKSNDSPITNDSNGFTIVEGTLSDAGSQTTILTVPGTENGQDTEYKCLVTSLEHAKVEEVTTATVEVFGKIFYNTHKLRVL